MAHVAKYHMSAVGALCAHFERLEDKNGEYVCYKNRDIDSSRTMNNYNLAPVHDNGQMSFVRDRLSQVEYVKRNNINVMCAWVLTLPKGFPNEREFFEESYRFLENRYGKENVISAYVHKDEVSPHLHFAFIPVKDNRLCASRVIDMNELKTFHKELQSYLEETLKQDVPVLNGATAGGNRTVAEMKAERDTLRAEEVSKKAELFIEQVEQEIVSLKQEKEVVETELNSLVQEKEQVVEETKVLVQEKSKVAVELKSLEKEFLGKKEIKELNASKGLLGSLKGITFEEYKALLNTALYVEEVEEENEELKKTIEEKDEKIQDAEDRVKKALSNTPPMEMRIENATLKSKITNMENWLSLLSDRLPNRYRINILNILDGCHPFNYHHTPSRDIS